MMQSITASHPFKKHHEWNVSIIELYSESNQTVITNACKSYISQLNQIIHKSSLYTFTSIINKYLYHMHSYTDRQILMNTVFDLIINDKISLCEYEWLTTDMINATRDAYLTACTRDEFYKMLTKVIRNGYSEVYDNIFRNACYKILQYYDIEYNVWTVARCSSERGWIHTKYIKNPIHVCINDQVVASLCVKNEYLDVLISLSMSTKPTLLCIDYINHIHTTTCITNYTYDEERNITSMHYTIKTYQANNITSELPALASEHDLIINYPNQQKN